MYGAIAASNSRVFVVEETGGVIMEIAFNSAKRAIMVRIVKSGFGRGILIGGLSATSRGRNMTQLYWIASQGTKSTLFSGGASDATVSVLLDLSSLSPPSLAPTSLAVSEMSRVAVWLDTGLNCVPSGPRHSCICPFCASAG